MGSVLDVVLIKAFVALVVKLQIHVIFAMVVTILPELSVEIAIFFCIALSLCAHQQVGTVNSVMPDITPCTTNVVIALYIPIVKIANKRHLFVANVH